ncbi:prolyl oligopeptidase family serine peptidase [Stieleria sp. TO1_6]|uniref:prolyl oligopeptidase family serine peptidase n=1 Tax=Stieleria tagensis TaxID=2956795 RepID=UPI00209B2CDE|nr:prolyl oligopeptidase family serine peptidase [Stieleria tagensis]MCO8122950.1 prolyl oligopeptidase family serine peptidase [Stieleria tagensis]
MSRLGIAFTIGWIFMTLTPPLGLTDEPSVVATDDPYLWLEEVEGDKALDWVRKRNGQSTELIQSASTFKQLESDLLEILDSDQRIPAVQKRGEYYYNFWRNGEHPRGVWRRTTMDEYRKEDPKWDIILDLDQVAKDENENWVWGGVSMLRPDYDLALVDLSRGGADATVTREFDVNQRAFVQDGFSRPEAKGGMEWIDRDTVFIQTDFGEGTMTESGYPRLAKKWKRGTPMESATLVFAGQPTDMSIGASHDDTPGYERNFAYRSIAFYNNELFLLPDSGEPIQIEVPNSAGKRVVRDWLLLELREPYTVGEIQYAAGSLIVTNINDFLKGERDFVVLFEPTDSTALSGFGFTKDYAYLNILEDVKNRIQILKPTDDDWQRMPLVGAPQFGTVGIRAVDSDESNEYFLTTTDYLTPTTLLMGEIGSQPETLKSLPAFFDASQLEIKQHFATSKDGTKVPYFMVAQKDLATTGDHPTLLYGYGGFEISLQPSYSASVGRAWTTQGGVYVVANIRGGGEYGPRWHQAALKENRVRAYEDFAAVAKDLFDRGITSPQKLGIQGGSNGGLLVGNMVTRYPELMAAAVCQVPLLDMRRYHKLLAGASWMAEYGDPDDPEQWKFIQTFSPYQRVQPETKYPSVLFMTSTRDDRVHPGHARKMMALMESQGHDVIYYENIEGGHGGAANNAQRARMQALAYTYLQQKLMTDRSQ